MKENKDYLSEEELENLIWDIEKNDLVKCPQELSEQILETMLCKTKDENILEFKRFRFQVLTTVAAAVMIVFLLPHFEHLQQRKDDFFIQIRYKTKEEAIMDDSIFKNMLGSVNLFADNNKFHFFKE